MQRRTGCDYQERCRRFTLSLELSGTTRLNSLRKLLDTPVEENYQILMVFPLDGVALDLSKSKTLFVSWNSLCNIIQLSRYFLEENFISLTGYIIVFFTKPRLRASLFIVVGF